MYKIKVDDFLKFERGILLSGKSEGYPLRDEILVDEDNKEYKVVGFMMKVDLTNRPVMIPHVVHSENLIGKTLQSKPNNQ